jgi:hypothetical protein
MKLFSLFLVLILFADSSLTFARGGRGGGGGGGRGGGGGMRGGGGGGARMSSGRSGDFSSRGSAPSSVNRSSRNVSNSRQDVNINRNVNVNASGGGYYGGGWGGYYPAGAAFAFTTTAVMTAVVIGDLVDTPQAEKPSDCEQKDVSGIAYVKCGEVWYKPMFNGTDVQYEVVKSPL